MGAAIQGAVLAGDVKDVLLLDVTPLSLGIETLGGVMTKIITRNTTIPARQSQVFTTAADNQTSVTISVLQGEREMSSDNKSIGRFDLVGIPSAPRGIPQIEVSFDIDANGILHVAAKDQGGTGKEQSIRITPSSGLSDEEIEQMVKDAEINAEADKKKKAIIEVKNQADTLIYSTEKSLAEHGDKVDEQTKKAIEEALADLKEKSAGDDADAITASIEKLTQSAHKLAEEIYKEAQAENAAKAEGGEQPQGDAGEPTPDDVVDAEFEEVKDEDKK